MKNNFYKLLGWIAWIAFVLNVIWENAQMPWYKGYFGFAEHFLICLRATFGDVIIILAIYVIISFIKGDWNWPVRIEKRVLAPTLILGLLVAIIIEQRALLSGAWGYADQMPLLPFFAVGLLPVLQMLILPIVTFWISGLINKKSKI